ncbi:1254_t:CDS:2, partial [Acaulospora morrowiae]
LLSGNFKDEISGDIFKSFRFPSVTNELSITLRLNVQRLDSGWLSIFQKGINNNNTRTPGIWLCPNTTKLHPRFSINDNWNFGIDEISIGLKLNK